MTKDELHQKLKKLASECERDFPHAAVMLLIILGSYYEISFQELEDLMADWAKERLKFMALD